MSCLEGVDGHVGAVYCCNHAPLTVEITKGGLPDSKCTKLFM